MTEVQLLSLFDTALASVCNCRRGGRCAKGWHTYARQHGPGARAFVVRSPPGHASRAMLNLPRPVVPAFIAAAQAAGVPHGMNDPRNIGWDRFNVDPRPHDGPFLAHWVQQTLN